MDEEDKEKTAFACHKGLFEFNVMPFGLSMLLQYFKNLIMLSYKVVLTLQHHTWITSWCLVQHWKNTWNILVLSLAS